MSDAREDNDHRHGKYLMGGDDCTFDSEELANACRRLGITGPLDSLLRELKVKENTSSNVKESTRKVNQKKTKRSQSRENDLNEVVDGYLESSLQAANKAAKNSFGQESWGRDSGARDLSPEPKRGGLESLGSVPQLADGDASGSSQMIHLASKVSWNIDYFFVMAYRPRPSNLILVYQNMISLGKFTYYAKTRRVNNTIRLLLSSHN